MVHGSHGRHEGHDVPAAKDPVCGMQVATGEGYSVMRQGTQFRFCSRKCLDQFEQEPERYMSGKGTGL